MELKLKMLRKAVTCVLAAVVLSTTTGCLPSPFEQDIPSTSWQVDDKGNRIKITNPGNGMTQEDIAAEKQAVKESLDRYYVGTKNEALATKMKEQFQNPQAAAAAQPKLSEDPEERKKQEAELYKKAVADFAPVLENIDTTGVSNEEQVTLASSLVMLNGMGASKVKVEVPNEIIMVTGETASIDMSKAIVTFEGEKTTMGEDPSGKSITYFVKKDGKWLVNGKKLKESLGINGTSMQIGTSAELTK